jgi:hypothetical protein
VQTTSTNGSYSEEFQMTTKTKCFLLLPLFLVFVSGCASSSTAARVSGRVTYKGNPVTAGTVTFHAKEGGILTCAIKSDGTYSRTDLSPGEMAVSVETESANTNRKVPESAYGGARGRAMSQGKDSGKASSMLSPAPSGFKPAETGVYVKIPPKYADKNTSGLAVTLTRGKNTKDFELTE